MKENIGGIDENLKNKTMQQAKLESKNQLPNSHRINYTFIFLSFLAGVLLPLQSSINATLIEPAKNIIAPAAISFATGTIALLFVSWYDPRGKVRETDEKESSTLDLIKTVPFVTVFFPGIIGGYYVTVGAAIGRELGFSLFFVIIVCGNLVSAAFTDHFGMLGFTRRKMTIYRSITMFLVFVGSALSAYDRISFSNDNSLSPWTTVLLMFLTFFSGSLFPIQVGLNSTLTRHMKSLPHRITLWSFACGTVYLVLATYFSAYLKSVEQFDIYGFTGSQFWQFIGGPLGAFYVFLTIFLGPLIGVSLFLVLSISGQLVGSLVIDSLGLFRSTQFDVTSTRILGVILVLFASTLFRYEVAIKALYHSYKSPNESILNKPEVNENLEQIKESEGEIILS